ncbi:MAG TPA: host-nuclease inhibitor Gam family protein [Candidatus Wunengus sp. YC60]|uniref:host-nuclease inhibitor Gam family protein n=1 Tax=Candidatus Wunengus sp. YC60 TaxID=3367697 RepID=UPI00402742EA
MARIKPKNSINTQDQAVAAMSRLNQIDSRLAQWNLDEAEDIATIRTDHHEVQKKAGRPGLEAEKALLVKELEAWALEAQGTWEKRTMETPFGRFGMRTTTPAVRLIKRVVKNFQDAVELIMINLPDFARRVFEIDKDKILAADRDGSLDVASLARCGLEVKQEEEFWVETNASKDLEEAAKKLKGA